MDTLQQLLRDNPIFFSRLGFCYDPPRADKDGRQIIFSRNFEKYRRTHQQFIDAGVKYHTTILHSGWVADGKWDYTLTDETLDTLLEGNPDILYIPRIKLNVPPDWCRNHPEDTFVYYGGPREPEEIAALAETELHDYLGYNSLVGYDSNGGKDVWHDDRPNMNGQIGLQSFSSPQWVKDASETLRRLLEHFAASKYAKQIVGVHIAYGMCGETILWGCWSSATSGRRGDFGITNRRRFEAYGIQKYGSREAALAKWGDFEPPAPIETEIPDATLPELFFEEGSKVRDYFSFVAETSSAAIEAFCKVIKDSEALFGHPMATGAFYGYMYNPYAPISGHLAIDRLLNSPYVDFISSPKGYHRCKAGDPGGEQGPSESMARKKVWLDEIDCLTHLDQRGGRADDEDDSVTLLWREATKNITHGQGFWWMDLGEGWYDSPRLMDQITTITKLQQDLKNIPGESAAEILLVVDDMSQRQMSVRYGLNAGLCFELHSELKLCGAPVDTLRLRDLFEVSLDKYKMVVFANCFFIDPAQRAFLLDKLQGKTVVWHYASGIMAPDYDTANFTALTGFSLREIARPDDQFMGYSTACARYAHSRNHIPGDFPLFTTDIQDGDEIISRYPGGEPMSVKRGNVCLCACPSLMAADFRKLAKSAGVTVYADCECAVFADNRLVGIFPRENFTGDIVFDGKKISAEIPAKRYVVLQRDGSVLSMGNDCQTR